MGAGNKNRYWSIMELVLVLLVAAGHMSLELMAARGRFQPDRPQMLFNSVAVLMWVGYVGFRACTVRGILRDWGLHLDHFPQALGRGLLFALPVAVALVVFGVWRGHWPLAPGFWLLLLLYPAWGLAQQFVLQALLMRNLEPWLPHLPARVVAAAGLFSAVHLPNVLLAVLAFPVGIAFSWVYAQRPNLWALGILHGCLGALFYYLVLGQDPGAIVLAMFHH